MQHAPSRGCWRSRGSATERPFRIPADWEAAFDVVFSMASSSTLRKRSGLWGDRPIVAPGGTVVTVAPNMYGFPGWATRWLSKGRIPHAPGINASDLSRSHLHAGLEVISAEYLIALMRG